MKTIYRILAATLFLGLSCHAGADQAQADNASAAPGHYTHSGLEYPPVFYQSNITDEAFKEKLSGYGAFKVLDEEAVGLPIGLMVLKDLHYKNDAANFTSGLLAASTLGLIPVVNKKEFSVYYLVFVQGERIARYEYSMSKAEVENLWTMNQDQTMKPEQEVFLENTIAKFLEDVRDNSEVQEVFQEYREYFAGTPY